MNVHFERIADAHCEWPQHEDPGQMVGVAGKLHPHGQHRPWVWEEEDALPRLLYMFISKSEVHVGLFTALPLTTYSSQISFMEAMTTAQ